jgi:thioredoxin 1
MNPNINSLSLLAKSSDAMLPSPKPAASIRSIIKFTWSTDEAAAIGRDVLRMLFKYLSLTSISNGYIYSFDIDKMIENANDANFSEITSEDVVLVDFYTTTCGPCKMYAKIIEEVAYELPFVKFVKVCGEYCPETFEKFGVTAVPTTIMFKDGKEADRFTGFRNNEKLKEKISQVLY